MYLEMAEDTTFRDVFLMTFRTFISPDQLFDMLVEKYRMDHPSGINEEEFVEWKEKCRLPTQRRVLTLFTIWLEDHRLLEEEPHIAQRLTDFLSLITPPAPLSPAAKLIMQSIKRLVGHPTHSRKHVTVTRILLQTFANPVKPLISVSPRRRRSKSIRNDLLKMEPNNIAEQLSLLEYKLYDKISPQECITHTKEPLGKSVANIIAFCSTHDKLAAWVKMSILNNEALGRRAETIEFWIRVAEVSTLNTSHVASG